MILWSQVLARRLARHGLAQPAPAEQLAEQVAVMCGAHAQVMPAAELSLGLRVAGATREVVRAALWDEHRLIRTFGPRGTVHVLAAADLPVWTGALAALPAGRTGLPPEAEVTPAQTEALVEALGAVLAEAELTVDEVGAALAERLGGWVNDPVLPAFQTMWARWRQVVVLAANRGVLVFGPNRGRNTTYTNPRRFLPGFKLLPPDEALAGMVRRYLHAYGPAAPEHLAQWLAAPRRWASDLFARLGDALEPVTVKGAQGASETLRANAGDGAESSAKPEPPRGVRLLPYFDAYVVGGHPRLWLFPGEAAERALGRGQAGNFQTVLVNGVVAGRWHARRAGKRLHLTVEMFTPLKPGQRRDLAVQVARAGELMEGTPDLTLGPVTAGAHA